MKPFQLIFANTRHYTTPLIIASIAMIALVGVQLLVPWIIKVLIQTITAPGATLTSMDMVTRLTVIVLVVFAARAGLQ